MNPPIVTLLTDFGLRDTFAGQVRGAILSVAPSCEIVDLTHHVAPQDVLGGAIQLWCAVEVFPSGTIHLAVVDPGVGSSRRAVAARAARGDVLVGPDNGLLAPALDRLGGTVAAVELTDRSFWRPAPSTTFHGRDIFGPVAAHLALGVALECLGPAVELARPFSLPPPRGLDGQVLAVDGFGNLLTNLPASTLPPRFVVELGGRRIEPAANYA
ncbi:MAG: SAM-dependent chlorinase/fluorinase, partial [Chloroflexota bacterium]|nr:SAM-dependent chlorinase/fluorinase [Chloroflexota bacterium]